MRDQYKTGEGSPDDDDSYLGYSVTTGEFDGDGDNTDVAVGMPRGAGLNGKVLVYNRNLTNTYNLTGDQVCMRPETKTTRIPVERVDLVH